MKFPKRSKPKTAVQKAEVAADRACSDYILERDTCDDMGTCFGCGRTFIRDGGIHAGHFITRDKNHTRYDPQNIHVECARCNSFLGGRQYEHGLFIDKLYGEGTAEKIQQKSNWAFPAKCDVQTLQFYAKVFRQRAKEIREMKKKGQWSMICDEWRKTDSMQKAMP